jgi:hypothetical protein
MSDEGEDNSQPIVLYAESWERLPDGGRQLLIRCKSADDYTALPKHMKFGKVEWRKVGFNSERRVAFYLLRSQGGGFESAHQVQ